MADEILEVGFKVLLTIDGVTAKFEERSLKPPGVDVGGSVNMTTQRNTKWRTAAPKKLLTLSPMSGTCTYKPSVFSQMATIAGQNKECTLTYPDNSTLVFWAFVNKWDPSGMDEENQPTAEIELIPTNRDEDTAGKPEKAPVFTAAP